MAHERILIVEDEVIVAEQLRNQLTTLDYEICGIASSAQEALQQFETEHPQLVLMDIHLPGSSMDGIDVADEFRRNSDVPVIFLTASSDKQTLERAKQTMPSGYLQKPLRQHEVETAIDIVLYKDRMERELQQAYDELERRVQERTAELEQRNREWQQEILDRVAAESSFSKEQALLRTLMDTSPDHIYFKDRQFRFLRINKSMAEWFGLESHEEAIGKTDFDFFTTEHARQALIDEERVMKEGRLLLGKEEKETWPDGRETWVSSAKVPLRDEEDRVIGIFGISRDITERKQVEAELRKYREHLEDLVEERTIELQQEIAERRQVEKRLQKAIEDAEAANRAKSEFLANMSHELRTPLNGILGYAQILKQEEQLTNLQRSGLDTIERSGKHLLRLVNEILDLAKIEAHKMELHETDVHFAGFLSGISEIIRIRAQQKGIAFRYETTSELPQFIHTDERQLSQILLNLLSNAVKFTERGGVSLKIGECRSLESYRHDSPGPDEAGALSPENGSRSSIRFQVSDSGVGIPESQLHSIFSPFAQVGDPARHKDGTGLGLAISRRLAHLMGSELYVRSVPGQGTTFWFDLCLDEVDREPAGLHLQPRNRSIKCVKGAGPMILVADDKDENRILLKDMLQPLGFRVLEAKNGEEAVEQTQAQQPDLILMDLIMPIMDGFEAVERIRRQSIGRDIIIFAVSASAFEQTRRKSVTVGCHDFLSKPISSEELLAKLEHYLQLEWIYDDTPELEEPITPPQQDELLELCKFARIGDIMKVRQYIDGLERDHPDYAAFCGRIRHLLSDMNIMKVQEFLKSYVLE